MLNAACKSERAVFDVERMYWDHGLVQLGERASLG